uniref:Tumor necrosis factor ligand superfamily member 10-1 n=1 Tax=Pomacea canaliculata TaxID=400727 RepID=A0A290WHW4_POMCA|nr:tumor necrosis factor ligand superfamily member 10-1 [Pomacea canaliculata]ATD50331.1 tumor necrosis factor ligand superfamily member 10-2 [Pomacea canaliculata]
MKTRLSSESSMDSTTSGDSTYAVRVEEELLVKGGGFPDRRQTQTRGRRRKLVVVTVISLVLSAISLVAVLLVGAFVFFNDKELIHGDLQAQVAASDEVCLPCVQLNSDPVSDTDSSLLDVLEVRRDDNSDLTVCCARTNAQFAALLKLIIQRQQTIKKLADSLEPAGGQNPASTNDTSAVSAHLLFKAGTGKEEIQQWKAPDGHGLSHVRPGLTFYDNTIYVITSGMYYVYCQILYQVDTTTGVVSSYVYRESLMNPMMSGIVLKTRHTKYVQQTDHHASYVGGLVALHKGDKLYVKLSDSDLVSNDEKGSFFGLFRVGE